MSVRTTEGEYGDLVATVVAKMVPKSAQTIRLKIKPLSLHHRVNELTPEEEARPRNSLTLTGSFSASLMHEWITSCLPEVHTTHHHDERGREVRLSGRNAGLTVAATPACLAGFLCPVQVPPRIASAAEETNGAASIMLHFRNVFTRSVLSVEYAKGSAIITSDSVSSIAIFKEVRRPACPQRSRA